MIKINHIYT